MHFNSSPTKNGNCTKKEIICRNGEKRVKRAIETTTMVTPHRHASFASTFTFESFAFNGHPSSIPLIARARNQAPNVRQIQKLNFKFDTLHMSHMWACTVSWARCECVSRRRSCELLLQGLFLPNTTVSKTWKYSSLFVGEFFFCVNPLQIHIAHVLTWAPAPEMILWRNGETETMAACAIAQKTAQDEVGLGECRWHQDAQLEKHHNFKFGKWIIIHFRLSGIHCTALTHCRDSQSNRCLHSFDALAHYHICVCVCADFSAVRRKFVFSIQFARVLSLCAFHWAETFVSAFKCL